MKYLVAFAVVTQSVYEEVNSLMIACQTQDQKSVKQLGIGVHQVLDRTVVESPQSVAFYRCLMDGWDATHRMVAPRLTELRPHAAKLWKQFIESDFLLLESEQVASCGLLPLLKDREIRSLHKHAKLEAYAIDAFGRALNDTIEFAMATGLALIVAATVVGHVMGDDEYGYSGVTV